MKKAALRRSFKPRKQIKTEYSLRENTSQTREWKRSKVGLESGLLKIDRNRRVAIFRARERLRKMKEWKLLTKEAKQKREASTIAKVTALYEKKKEDLRRAWYIKNEQSV